MNDQTVGRAGLPLPGASRRADASSTGAHGAFPAPSFYTAGDGATSYLIHLAVASSGSDDHIQSWLGNACPHGVVSMSARLASSMPIGGRHFSALQKGALILKCEALQLLAEYYNIRSNSNIIVPTDRTGQLLPAREFARDMQAHIDRLPLEPCLRAGYVVRDDHKDHGLAIVYLRVGGKARVLIVDSTGTKSSGDLPTLLASCTGLPVHHQAECLQGDFVSCYANALLMCRALTSVRSDGRALVESVDDLLENARPLGDGTYSLKLADDRLLKTVQLPRFDDLHRGKDRPVVHERKDEQGRRHPEDLDQFRQRHGQYSKETRGGYLYEKNFELAYRALLQGYLQEMQVPCRNGPGWTHAMKQEFLRSGKARLREVRERDGGLPNPVDLQIFDDWLSGLGVVLDPELDSATSDSSDSSSDEDSSESDAESRCQV